jgi:hypothetical protein
MVLFMFGEGGGAGSPHPVTPPPNPPSSDVVACFRGQEKVEEIVKQVPHSDVSVQ